MGRKGNGFVRFWVGFVRFFPDFWSGLPGFTWIYLGSIPFLGQFFFYFGRVVMDFTRVLYGLMRRVERRSDFRWAKFTSDFFLKNSVTILSGPMGHPIQMGFASGSERIGSRCYLTNQVLPGAIIYNTAQLIKCR
jgi:hypothetical protein